MSRRRVNALWWSALACWAAGILWLSALSPAELPDPAFWLSDKINHVVAYAVGGWLASGALKTSLPRTPAATRFALTIALIAVFGALDEALQTFTPGRTGGSAADWIANLLGAAIGALLGLRLGPSAGHGGTAVTRE